MAALLVSCQVFHVTPNDTQRVMRQIRAELGRKLFQKEPRRLLWLGVHLSVIAVGSIWARGLVQSGVHPLWFLPLSVLIGLSFAGLAFVAHEALHGALCRSRTLSRLVGAVGFFPFCVSPRLWVAWHNRVHHGNTNIEGRDPDAYPTLAEYRSSRAARLSVLLGAPRLGKWRGVLTLLIGFTMQSTQVLLFAGVRGHLTRKDHFFALLHTTTCWALWISWGLWLGPILFLVLFVLPLLIGNSIVMAHIITNHSLSPLCDQNDALSTSLSVSVPRWFNFYTLGFGYHVEHHLFPSMSHRRGPEVSKLLQKWAKGRYQSMPLSRALSLLFRTPRVYRDAKVLCDPDTGDVWTTLGSAKHPSEKARSYPPPPPRAAKPGTVREISVSKSAPQPSTLPPPAA